MMLGGVPGFGSRGIDRVVLVWEYLDGPVPFDLAGSVPSSCSVFSRSVRYTFLVLKAAISGSRTISVSVT